jgi:hypothetical protein
MLTGMRIVKRLRRRLVTSGGSEVPPSWPSRLPCRLERSPGPLAIDAAGDGSRRKPTGILLGRHALALEAPHLPSYAADDLDLDRHLGVTMPADIGDHLHAGCGLPGSSDAGGRGPDVPFAPKVKTRPGSFILQQGWRGAQSRAAVQLGNWLASYWATSAGHSRPASPSPKHGPAPGRLSRLRKAVLQGSGESYPQDGRKWRGGAERGTLLRLIPRTETYVIRHFQERMPYGLFVPEVA